MFLTYGIGLLVMGAMFLTLALVERRKFLDFQKNAASCQGTVLRSTGVMMGRGKFQSPVVTVTVTYTVKEKTYTADLPTTLEEGKKFKKGQSLPMQYDVRDPQKAARRPQDDHQRKDKRAMFYVAAVSLAAGAVLLGIGLV